MKRTKRAIVCAATLVLACGQLAVAEPEKELLRQLAEHHVTREYGRASKEMKLSGHEESKALAITLLGKDSKGMLSYLVIADIAVPVSMGTPQPDKKWYRARMLRIAGPQIGGWPSIRTQKLSAAEHRVLDAVKSLRDKAVEDPSLKDIVRSKVLPEQMQRPWKGDEWHNAEMSVRATTVHAYTFDFKTKVGMGGNLMGVTLYIGSNGEILAKTEAMLHVD